ncbi:MAG: 4-hydroxy-tetrahydrodipicolinate reductase [Alphaproteobacteria bacterium]|nr:4-hydroxy-tetrahydrodipicolinate reductase [Alphaproteobacteria bacterium]
MKIGIVGCAGRMGQMLVREVLQTPGAHLAGGTERPGTDAVGRDIGELVGFGKLGIAVSASAAEMFQHVDAVIDFTVPPASVEHAKIAASLGKVLIIGTTGMSEAQSRQVEEQAQKARIVMAPNMSVGVTLAAALVEQVARVLDDMYDIEIVEMHHRHKVDAPSGTALGLGRAAAMGRGVSLDQVACKSRDGQTGVRPRGEIGFATLRGGDVVGDHTVIFAAEGERFEITHKASSRQIFAKGAVRAALWCKGRRHGLYSMKDVLGL